jgi:hypothetical protein
MNSHAVKELVEIDDDQTYEKEREEREERRYRLIHDTKIVKL